MIDRKEIYSLQELLDDISDPPDPIVDAGVLLKGTLLAIIAPKKANKTFLAYNFGVAIASGTDFAGFKIKGEHSVLMLSAEGGYYPNRERLKTIAKGIDEEALKRFHYVPIVNLDFNRDKTLGQLHIWIKKLKPDVLIIDPLSKFHTADENSAKEMSKVCKNLRNFVEEYDLSLIVVHHTGKDQYKGARGSSVIGAEYDSAIYLKKYKDYHHFEFDMRHVAAPETVKLRFNSETFWFGSQEDNKAVIQLKDNGPTTRTNLTKILMNKDDISKATAYRAINKAEDCGKIVATGDILELV